MILSGSRSTSARLPDPATTRAIFGQEEAAGAQAIAVQGDAELQVAVGEGQGRGTVPWLDAIGMVAKESGVLSPARGRQQHAHGFGNAAPIARQQLDNLVQAGGIRSTAGENGVVLGGERWRGGIGRPCGPGSPRQY